MHYRSHFARDLENLATKEATRSKFNPLRIRFFIPRLLTAQ
ncbi:hypothetical protein HMPREF0201_00004 [Cedecea davisae DSM 4568]|uniref:Uncharacterized protein n=1 Tax=Cedecea davisae DSM 4568 TaxID=566551 RepID=S3JLJ8_9ENTR|nr:hypothetical protein HMPREF0201_00004 [Cedecea davisae DSM 4568]